MKKQFIIFIILGIILVLGSCTDTPPELYLSFDIIDFDVSGSDVDVDYTLKNGGEATLENCKIQIAVETDEGTFKKWTNGVDLSVDETYTVNNFAIYVGSNLNTVTSAYVTAAGWDSPEDSKSVAGTIIYYDK